MVNRPQPVGVKSLERSMRLRYQVRYVTLPAQKIFGMVGRCGGGYNTVWSDWSDEGRNKRELIMREFEEELNSISGHYQKLEASILKEGMRNPVIITCGYPRRRAIECLPPEMRTIPHQDLLLLETTTGGSRLHVCQKYNMNIRCLVNDWMDRFREFPIVKTVEDARSYYKDQPKGLSFHRRLGLVEDFDQHKIGYHLGPEWSEDRIMPMRSVAWIKIMNKHGYRVDKLPQIVSDALGKAGVDQNNLN